MPRQGEGKGRVFDRDAGGFSERWRHGRGGASSGKARRVYVVELVAGLDPDSVMPKKGTRWTPEQVGLLRAWIDQGARWPDGITFAKPPPENLQPRAVALGRAAERASDRQSARWLLRGERRLTSRRRSRTASLRGASISISSACCRRPSSSTPSCGSARRTSAPSSFASCSRDKRNYADHWLTFWNDLLRNDYKGDRLHRRRAQADQRLALPGADRKQAVRPLRRGARESDARRAKGFSRGIIWRGNVNASMLPPMQAAQNVSQVFLGVNLKCASCHDSFVNDWSLADAYGLAAVYADEPLELIHCDKPTGKKSAPRFLYPEIGALDPGAAEGGAAAAPRGDHHEPEKRPAVAHDRQSPVGAAARARAGRAARRHGAAAPGIATCSTGWPRISWRTATT